MKRKLVPLFFLLFSMALFINAQTPSIGFTPLNPSYETNSNIVVTAQLNSGGLLDQLCGITYEIYRDGILIENLSDYGTVSYRVRTQGLNYTDVPITEGSGTIGYQTYQAFTLGVFDNYCVNRNRPIEITLKFFEAGTYKMVTKLNSCSNTGTIIGSNYTANGNPDCGTSVHLDMAASECTSPNELGTWFFEANVVRPATTPHIEFSGVPSSSTTNQNIAITGKIYSEGTIDQLCSFGYKFYKDGSLITNISDYGTINYTVRQEGLNYYNGSITNGSGAIELDINSSHIAAYTLGILDNSCVDRNRPVDFEVNFTQPGVYTMVAAINSCSNTTGIDVVGSFTAVDCDGLIHDDKTASTCTTPTQISQKTIVINITEPPHIEYFEIEPSYEIGEEFSVTAKIYSNGLIDNLCGIGYQILKDGEPIQNISDYGTLNYRVRKEGLEYFEGSLTNGSGMISLTVDEYEIGAFTLGIIDNTCVNRNRPIEFTANFTEAGHYTIVSRIYSCTNTTGIEVVGSFTAQDCDGQIHDDKIATTCENPNRIAQEEVEIIIVNHSYPVNYNVIGSNGTLGATVDGLAITSGDLVQEGKDVVFTATPDAHYRVKEWKANSVVVSGNTSNVFNISNIVSDTTVSVEFEVDDTKISDLRNVSINVYPNPSTGIYTIESDGNYTINVIDVQGKTILSQEILKGKTILNLSSYKDGLYIIRFMNNSDSFIIRIKKSK